MEKLFVAVACRTIRETASLGRGTHQRLDHALELGRQLYNAALQERIDCYQKTHKSISCQDQCKSLTLIRRDDTTYRDLPVDLMRRSALLRLDEAFKHFFRRVKLLRNHPKAGLKVGFPRFKSKHRGIRSLTTLSFTLHRSGRRFAVGIKGLGKFKVKYAPPKEAIKFVRIVRTPVRVVVQFCYSKTIDVQQQADEPVGIDLGVSKQAVLSTGESVDKRTPDMRRTKRLQRRLSKAVKGSNNRTKKRLAYAKERSRISEREKQAMHRLTSELVKRHKHFVVEDLAYQNMTRSAKGDAENPGRHVAQKSGLNRSILEQYWGYFVQLLTYKAASAGGWVERVPPHNTSKLCSRCGWKHPDLTLKIRVFECAICGLCLCRDRNAAINIKHRSTRWSGGNCLEQPDTRLDERTSHPAGCGWWRVEQYG